MSIRRFHNRFHFARPREAQQAQSGQPTVLTQYSRWDNSTPCLNRTAWPFACPPAAPCRTLRLVNPHPLRAQLGFAGLLLLAGLALWAIVSRPLPQVFSQAIPHTNLNPELQVIRPIVPGDHLQLLYRFWLGMDALSGHSPPFQNIYEFNLGAAVARIQPNLYYLPFSLVYAAVAPWAGHAAGWNAAGLASVLLGVWFLGLLARRFVDSPILALLAALVAAALPYRWITLFTGSPTGFAMAFPPLLAYGLDRAVRDRSVWGGFLAGLALLFSFGADIHTFYFSALATPYFLMFSLWWAAPGIRQWPGRIRQAAVPLVAFALPAAAASAMGATLNRHLAGSSMAAGRSLAEMASYSPPALGLVSAEPGGIASHVYLGIPLLLLIAVLFVAWVVRRFDSGSARPTADAVAVAAGMAAIAIATLLALGIHGPFAGLPVRLARKAVPHFTMIRQTVKIFCMLPTLLAPLLALLCGGIFRPWPPRRRRVAMGIAILLAGWAGWDSLAQMAPGFCRLPRQNIAYAAVAGDETANAGRPAHALALPLWPGDSHWSSLYEYAVMLSGVRLVNGYSPAVPAGYYETVFKKYESLNQGSGDDGQLDDLLAMGVRHLIFHANAFPEKVSPFPAAATLRSLVGHPRLALIADDGLTFAFRILPKHVIEHVAPANWVQTLYCPARQWPWSPPLGIQPTGSAPLTWRTPICSTPGSRYLLKLADGTAHPILIPPGSSGIASLTQPIAGLPDWMQADLPTPTGALVSAVSGRVVLERALLTAGELPAPRPDGSIQIPPALLFHVGHCSPGNDSVRFNPETVPARRVLYGPDLPFPPGTYDIVLAYRLPAAAGSDDEPPGFFRVLDLSNPQPLVDAALDPAAESVAFPAISIGSEPIRFEFHYAGHGPVVLDNIRLVPATLQLRPAAP